MIGRRTAVIFCMRIPIRKRNRISGCFPCRTKNRSLFFKRSSMKRTLDFLRMENGSPMLLTKSADQKLMCDLFQRLKVENGKFPQEEALSHFGERWERSCTILRL